MDEEKKKSMTLLELVTIRLQEIETQRKKQEEAKKKEYGGIQLDLPL